MEKQEMLLIATKYNGKNCSIEEMCDSDDCYHLSRKEGDKIKEKIADYMVELEEIGTTAFYEKYKEFKLY